MIAVIQRVSSSCVKVHEEVVGKIGIGLNILLGVKKGDSKDDTIKLVNKIVNLRIFHDDNKKMNLSLLDVKGEALIISQFTLAGNVKKGRRPSFEDSKEPEIAKKMYDEFVEEFKSIGIKTETGKFGAMMDVEIHNDGPVTFIIDSKELG
ncbi:MAG: D-tyrosyl-tRNA(Tyr) deacylase [Arcobacter sp.]|nr:D-tyrosyl-tRNA(Tyr) deacylase [Arcobacter sp.]